METYFLTSSPFHLVKTDFLSSGNSILLFRTLLKFLGFEGSRFFFKESLFLLVETDFLTSGSFFFFHFSGSPDSESYFLSSGNVFLNKFFIPYGGEAFSVLWKPFSLT